MTGPLVRAAGPGDLADVTAIYREAFAGSMGVSLGPSYTRAFVEWFLAGGGTCLVAEVAPSIPVGFVVGAAVGAEGDRQRVLRPLVVRALLTRPTLLGDARIRAELQRQVAGRLARRPTGAAPPGVAPDAETYSLVGIGTRRSHRGTGVGHHLVEAFESAALADGRSQVRLSVYRDNEAALALYRAHGWVPEPHPTNPDVVFCRKRLGR